MMLSDVYGSMKRQAELICSCVKNNEVEQKSLVPDLLGVDYQGVWQISESALVLKRVLGKSAFGGV